VRDASASRRRRLTRDLQPHVASLLDGVPVPVAGGMRDRKMQRALMQFFKPENYFMVREALLKAGRADLIGSGCDCLIPSNGLLSSELWMFASRFDHWHIGIVVLDFSTSLR